MLQLSPSQAFDSLLYREILMEELCCTWRGRCDVMYAVDNTGIRFGREQWLKDILVVKHRRLMFVKAE